MTKDETKAVAFMAILIALAGVARAFNKPAPMVVNAAQVDLGAFHAANQALAKQEQPNRRRRPPAAPSNPLPSRPPTPIVYVDKSAPMDLNRASAQELERLPGIGPAVAQRIVARRDSVGRFKRIEDLDPIRGIGPSLIEKLRPLLQIR